MTTLYKQHDLTVNITALQQGPIQTNTQFWTMDRNTPRKMVSITHKGTPLDLTGAKVIFGFEFVDAGSRMVLDSDSENVVIEYTEGGVVSVMLPNQVNYSGNVYIFLYIVYDNGRSFDIGHPIITNFQESWLDTELPDMQDWYFSNLEDLFNEMRQRVEEMLWNIEVGIQNEADRIVDEAVDRIQQAVDDNSINDMGFGANNLIANATEPIVINPAGNATSAQWNSEGVMLPNTTYTFSADTEYLQGNETHVLVEFREVSTNNGFDPQVIEIVNGRITYTSTTPNIDAIFQVRVFGASGWAVTPGNTLRLSNISLTKGAQPQPFRPSFEDDMTRLDRIENLQPITRRTVATFEDGNSNPHIVEWGNDSVNLVTPSVMMTAWNAVNTNNISQINSSRTTATTGQPNAMCQKRFTFNIIEHLERNYSTAIWQGFTSLEDKVRIARQIVNRIACVWDGHGVTNGVNWVGIRAATSLIAWSGVIIPHTNSIVQRLIFDRSTGLLETHILSDGTCRFLVHTAEGQTTPIGGASLTTAFVQFEVDVDITLASTDYVEGRISEALGTIAEPVKLALNPPSKQPREENLQEKVDRLEGCIVALLEGIEKAKDSLENPVIEEEIEEIETEEDL